jgi:hypothetical protein
MSQPRDDDDRDPAHWRDERELPLAELTEAMAVYSTEGQMDDPTGGDAGAEEAFGDDPFVREAEEYAAEHEGDPDPDSEVGRALRPSPEGRSGPA